MSQRIETVIVGGGQAGLAVSYHLSKLGREHIVLEQAQQAANAWRNDRWDSFTLVTPNWAFRLPGAEYDGPDPDGFMPRDEIVARLERYVDDYRLPVEYSTRVSAVEPMPGGRGYRVITDQAVLEADNVIIATGLFQQPKIPSLARDIDPAVMQISSGQYRKPDSLPPGAVLVVGSAQSGCQIAEDLYLSGRRVYLCVGTAGRVPRRYRGRDTFRWLEAIGLFERTVDQLESPRERFEANPHVTGARGGHTINLHQFVRDGVVLLGRLSAADGHKVQLVPNLYDNLAKVDGFEAEIIKLVDGYIARTGQEAPTEQLPQLRDGYDSELITNLDLRRTDVNTIIWATGYHFDFSLVKLPVLDADGFPVTSRGVTGFPGLYFVGMPWLHSQASGLFFGVGQDAAHIAAAIAGS